MERAHTAEAENIDLKARIVELGRQLELERSLTAKSYENDDKKSGSLQLRVVGLLCLRKRRYADRMHRSQSIGLNNNLKKPL